MATKTIAVSASGVKAHGTARRRAGRGREASEPFRGTAPLRSAYVAAVDLAAYIGQAMKREEYWRRRALHAEGKIRRVGCVVEGIQDGVAGRVRRVLTSGKVGEEVREDNEARAEVAAKLLDAVYLYGHYQLKRTNVVRVALEYVAPDAAKRLDEEGYDAQVARQVRREMFPDPDDEEE